MLECVVNVSEGSRENVLERMGGAAGPALLDVHSDAAHHRSVFTLAGPAVVAAVQALALAVVASLDLRRHTGAHPRLGVLDVVPFVPLHGSSMADAVAARDAFIAWLGDEVGLPAFAYGERAPTLPEVRREAFRSLVPTAGPGLPHPTAGAVAVGARPVLLAYNLWLARPDLSRARSVARSIRGPAVRALGLRVGNRVQVSCNLVDPAAVGPAAAYDAVAGLATVAGAELVGLAPESVLAAIDPDRWADLDLSPDRTIEARLRRTW